MRAVELICLIVRSEIGGPGKRNYKNTKNSFPPGSTRHHVRLHRNICVPRADASLVSAQPLAVVGRIHRNAGDHDLNGLLRVGAAQDPDQLHIPGHIHALDVLHAGPRHQPVPCQRSHDGGGHYSGGLSRAHPLRLPDQVGLHGDGRDAAGRPRRPYALRHPVHVFPQSNVAAGVRVPRRAPLLLLSGLRYTDDDGRQAQVLDQSRGVRVRRTEPVHGHHQHLYVHPGHSGQH